MSKINIVDQLYNDIMELILYLDQLKQPSFRNIAEEHFKKVLLLTSASYFETLLTDNIINLSKQISQNEILVELIKNKALNRQFHTLFDWKSQNANQFFALFGETFLASMKKDVNENTNLDKSIKAFLEIGRERNRMVHENFGAYTLEKTIDEIYNLHKNAIAFIDSVTERLSHV